MKAPKILPRVAHNAGISEGLALKLWRRALSELEYTSIDREDPEFFGLAVKRWLDLTREESGQESSLDGISPPGLNWMLDHQARLSILSLTTAQNAMKFWQNTWQDVLNIGKAA